jgi:hypothetical protein
MSYEYYYDIKSLIDDARWLCFFGMGGSTPLTSGDPRTSWNRDGGRPGGRKKEILSVAFCSHQNS